jgi:hypothetical protein
MILNQRLYKYVVNSILIVLTSILVWEYAKVWYGINVLPLIEQNVFGLLSKPYVYRQFVPILAQMIIRFGGIRADIAVIVIIYSSALGFVYSLKYLYTAFWKMTIFTDLTALLGIELLFLIIIKDQHIYDMSTAFFFTLELALLARNKFILFSLLFPLACLNRETTIILTLLFMVFFFRKIKLGFFLTALAYQVLAYLIIRLIIMHLFSKNPGTIVFFGPLQNLLTYFKNPFLTFAFISLSSLLFFIIIYKWHEKPVFLRTAFLVFFPSFTILYFLFGVSFEIRVFIEIYPIALLLALHSLVFILKVKPNPFISVSG